jgi:hypothetical protein
MHAMWVHGHAAQSELAAKRLLQGDGVAYSGRPDEELWVHFAVPTPVIIADQRPALVRAFVLFRTEGGAAIVKVGIWDGARLAAEFDDLLLEGDHSQRLDEGNTFVIGSPFPVFWGIGISVLTRFGHQTLSKAGCVRFASAGADFE